MAELPLDHSSTQSLYIDSREKGSTQNVYACTRAYQKWGIICNFWTNGRIFKCLTFLESSACLFQHRLVKNAKDVRRTPYDVKELTAKSLIKIYYLFNLNHYTIDQRNVTLSTMSPFPPIWMLKLLRLLSALMMIYQWLESSPMKNVPRTFCWGSCS